MTRKICDSCGGEVKLYSKSKSTSFICGVCTDHLEKFCINVKHDEQEFQDMLNKKKGYINEKKKRLYNK